MNRKHIEDICINAYTTQNTRAMIAVDDSEDFVIVYKIMSNIFEKYDCILRRSNKSITTSNQIGNTIHFNLHNGSHISIISYEDEDSSPINSLPIPRVLAVTKHMIFNGIQQFGSLLGYFANEDVELIVI